MALLQTAKLNDAKPMMWLTYPSDRRPSSYPVETLEVSMLLRVSVRDGSSVIATDITVF
jgi:hypothetical protein